jgi:nitroreductase
VELQELLRRRRMIRRYDNERPLPIEDVDAVVDAALRAPSAGYTQAVSFLVVTGSDVADYWATTTGNRPPDKWLSGMRTAPVLILIWTDQEAYLARYAEADKGWTDRDPDRWSAPYWHVDAGMSVMAALLTAVDRGLGACFFGVPRDRQQLVRDRFGVPARQLSVGAISLGYAAANRARPPRRLRKPREQLVHRGRWGQSGS